ncbi:MAG: O-antigen ligase family protein [Candidatus Magasanikbacteria bacterium]
MQERLTTRSIFYSWRTVLLIALFFGIRIISFYTSEQPYIQGFLVFCVMMLLGLTFFKSPSTAWGLIMMELFLGGSGHMLEFFGLSLRTVMILVFLFLWIIYSLTTRESELKVFFTHNLYLVLVPMALFIVFSFFVGMAHGHAVRNIIQDAIPFVFFLLFLPAYYLFNNDKTKELFIRLIGVFIISSALFSLYTFTLFSTGLSKLHGQYYTWFRDVAMGKITEVTPFFYRVVTPEHLLIPLIVLIICSLLMKNEKHHNMWRFLFIMCSVVLMLNFSRAYLLGIAVGFLFLLYKHTFKRWIIVSVWNATIMVLIFMSINILFSFGKSLGLEIVGIRLGSFVNPTMEVSTNTRIALLEPIFNIIEDHPFIGNGIGSSFSYLNPYTNTTLITRNYDWGYLEMWAELGILGAIWFIILIAVLIFELIKKIREVSDFHDLYVGLLAGIIAILIMNVTTPVLFHVLGIFYLAFVMAFISKPINIFDEVVTVLYRIFNKLKT